jgi:hypothetical protein
MKKFTVLFFLIIITHLKINAQTSTQVNNVINITLSSDYNNQTWSNELALNITNSQTIVISGKFYSDVAVNIIPKGTNSIIIKPMDYDYFITNKAEGATVVRPKANSGPVKGPVSISLYPNPVQSNLNFTCADLLVTSYQIYDLNGLLKINQTITATNSGIIDVSGLTAGNYILNLQLQNNSFIRIQFIKN